ncbi:hypothetical protein Rcae01_06142 [Novipirellula caenicola]|uniref:Uncharacterized protein n=1 Tax=Novipirellula caenicola TaxID=1536901 RepID=A0ABP9VZS4_9BACT
MDNVSHWPSLHLPPLPSAARERSDGPLRPPVVDLAKDPASRRPSPPRRRPHSITTPHRCSPPQTQATDARSVLNRSKPREQSRKSRILHKLLHQPPLPSAARERSDGPSRPPVVDLAKDPAHIRPSTTPRRPHSITPPHYTRFLRCIRKWILHGQFEQRQAETPEPQIPSFSVISLSSCSMTSSPFGASRHLPSSSSGSEQKSSENSLATAAWIANNPILAIAVELSGVPPEQPKVHVA